MCVHHRSDDKSNFKLENASSIYRHAKSYMRVKSMCIFLKIAYSDLLAEFANIMICSFVD